MTLSSFRSIRGLACLLLLAASSSALALGRPSPQPSQPEFKSARSAAKQSKKAGGQTPRSTPLYSSRLAPTIAGRYDNDRYEAEGMFHSLRWRQPPLSSLGGNPSRTRNARTQLHSSLYTRGGASSGLIEQWEATERAALAQTRRTRALLGGAAALAAAVAVNAVVGGPSKSAAEAVMSRVVAPLFTAQFWGAAAPWASICLKTSPMPTILGVIKNEDTGGLPLLPYSAMATLTFVLVVYGILVRDPKIFITHGIGHALSMFYCLSFLRHHDQSSGVSLPGTTTHHIKASLSIASTISLAVILFGRAAAPLVGYTSALLSMVMYAGPLSAAKRAIQNRSARSIPLPYAVASLFNSIAWTVYGYFGRNNDVAVWAPGLIGLVSAGTQVGLHIVFGNGPPNPRPEAAVIGGKPRPLAKAA
uniref:Sugar transporter SWEET1 n=1 Tax=Odontella aurita TaxID=265563 RepID=A0A7S4J1N9_9STRA|mmetsp:Transcript_35501/g.106000  ORF Transcript_35501/g.106000 Transcript_35501/m.106000 type:complete len:418 (+) Transcript_35501:401-1654(+)